MGLGGQCHAPAALPPGKTRYPLNRRLGGPQSRSGRMRKISPTHRDSIPGPSSLQSPRVVKRITVAPAIRRLYVYVHMSNIAGSSLRCFGMRRGVCRYLVTDVSEKQNISPIFKGRAIIKSPASVGPIFKGRAIIKSPASVD
jgi:hypothetical protein